MSKTNKRLVSILLCLAMVLAVLPMAVFAADTTTVYFANTGNWDTVAVYWWGSASTNPAWPGEVMTDLGNGYWSYDVPSDITGIVFNNNDKGAQTSDLSMPTDGSNYYNNADGSWSVYTGAEIEVVEVEYFLRGNMNTWAADSTNKMTKQDDGTYAITLSLEAGNYEYKASLADWSWSCPSGDNATLSLAEAADVTFVLNVEEGTLTNNAPTVEEPVVYDYYVAGSANLCGVEWDPAQNQMTYNEKTGLYEIMFPVWEAGTYEYKITTGSWETPSYGPAEGGNYTVVVKNPGEVTITFNAETTEVICDVYEFGEAELKFQLNADASADDASVDLRIITYVTSLNYSNVEFRISINGETVFVDCEVVYEAINANGASLTCRDIFGCEGYLVTYTLTDIPAEYYGSDIQVQAAFQGLDGSLNGTSFRTIVLSDVLV